MAMPHSRGSLLEDISPSNGRLLVAEDNAALREYLVAVLRAEGYEVVLSRQDDLD
jgi:CheY-like chemotaxis protein